MSDITVIVTEVINQAGVVYLKERGVNVIELPPGSTEETLAGLIAGADGLITRGSIKITREMMESSPRLTSVGGSTASGATTWTWWRPGSWARGCVTRLTP